ncbi:ketopantoate reductase PanE/ApbA C terminal-domain-containing protein [Limtongia smithiae]|uniref:ketopantoate reductase PanE/ApbA C terminal-domain-containing protein n=1 Tax=Limtongia smithiae TaxID=1125753 RepID=UPI0034CEA5D2
MADTRLSVLSVGSSPVSAFVAWRLSTSSAADVSLVWKSQYDIVVNYGISFKSDQLGAERYRAHNVFRTVDDAAIPSGYDYIVLCVKPLPDVYDLASVIAPVVTPGHTCIVVNTTAGIGIESYLEAAFPSNVVLSLVADTSILQTAAADFEQIGSDARFYIGPNPVGPRPADPSLVEDMTASFALTLEAGGVKCTVSKNIRQQQWEKCIAPIALHPLSVLLDEPNLATLVQVPHVRSTVANLVAELITIASSQKCVFPDPRAFAHAVLDDFAAAAAGQKPSMMYQDYQARRPMEIEVLLANPLHLSELASLRTPTLELLYILLSRLNKINQSQPPTAPPPPAPPSRSASVAPGQVRRLTTANGINDLRKPPNGVNGYASRRPVSRRGSYDNTVDDLGPALAYVNGGGRTSAATSGSNSPNGRPELADPSMPSLHDLSIREQEFDLRRRELELRERELAIQQQHIRGSRLPPPHMPRAQTYSGSSSMSEAGNHGEDYFTPAPSHPEDVDMMLVTSRRNRRTTSSMPRKSPESGGGFAGLTRFLRPSSSSRKVSMSDGAGGFDYNDAFMDSQLAYTSDRYNEVDSRALADQSRTNSMSSNVQRPSYVPPQGSYNALPQRGVPLGAPPQQHSTRFRYAPNIRAVPPQMDPQLSPQMQVRMLRSMVAAGPGPMDALLSAVGTQSSPSQQRKSQLPPSLPASGAPPPPPPQMQQYQQPQYAPPPPPPPPQQIYQQQPNYPVVPASATPVPPGRGVAPNVDAQLYAAAALVNKDHRLNKNSVHRKPSLTGSASASASASTSNGNGSGNSSSASSLEQK